MADIVLGSSKQHLDRHTGMEVYLRHGFVSWIEHRAAAGFDWEARLGKVYFMTGELIFSTARQEIQEIIDENGILPDDYNSYELIRAFYHIDSGDGVDRECTDFSTPENFPPEIAQAIKSGKMRGMLMSPELLTKSALAEYKKILHPAQVKYDKIMKPHWTKYNKTAEPALDEYNKIAEPALDEYETARQKVFWDLFAIQGNRVKAWRD